jgi:hypothetical protein
MIFRSDPTGAAIFAAPGDEGFQSPVSSFQEQRGAPKLETGNGALETAFTSGESACR